MSRTKVPPLSSDAPHAGFLVEGRSDVGRVREENQDFMGVFRVPGRLLAVVADGMGGHSGGYEASRVAVDAMRKALLEDPTANPRDVLTRGIVGAHQAIRSISDQTAELEGMGTTIVAALMEDQQAWLAHVGDSRAYHLRGADIGLSTLDHSRVHRMLLAGMLAPDKVANHPMGHILERSVGASSVIEPDVAEQSIRLAAGDRLLLCSDGVWGVVADGDLAKACAVEDLALAAEGAIGLALARETDDNATLVCVQATEGHPSAGPVVDVRSTHGMPGYAPAAGAAPAAVANSVSVPAPEGRVAVAARPEPPPLRRYKAKAVGVVALLTVLGGSLLAWNTWADRSPEPDRQERRHRAEEAEGKGSAVRNDQEPEGRSGETSPAGGNDVNNGRHASESPDKDVENVAPKVDRPANAVDKAPKTKNNSP